jgi:hypothetical protein
MGTNVLFFYAMIFLPEVSYGTTWQYGAILDAGSTSTKVKIYRWPPRTSLKSVLDIKQVGNSEKYSPGIILSDTSKITIKIQMKFYLLLLTSTKTLSCGHLMV